jgi:hypothetical protein
LARNESTELLIEEDERGQEADHATDQQELELKPLPMWAVVLLVIFFPVGILVYIYRQNARKNR